MHELLGPHIGPIGPARSEQHVESSSGRVEVHGSALRVSNMHARGIMHAAFELEKVGRRDGGHEASTQHAGSLCCKRQGQARFASFETLRCDALGDSESLTQAQQGVGSRNASIWQALSYLSFSSRAHTGTSFAMEWEKVRTEFFTTASSGCM